MLGDVVMALLALLCQVVFLTCQKTPREGLFNHAALNITFLTRCSLRTQTKAAYFTVFYATNYTYTYDRGLNTKYQLLKGSIGQWSTSNVRILLSGKFRTNFRSSFRGSNRPLRWGPWTRTTSRSPSLTSAGSGRYICREDNQISLMDTKGREPWSCGYGRRLMFWRLWVQIPAPYTGWKNFTYNCCKNCNVCLKKTENKQKSGWPI